MSVGFVSYGSYIPRYRLSSTEISQSWSKSKNTLNFYKSVPGLDEDAITIAIEAAENALRPISFNPRQIESILVGSESHPYAVKPSSTIVGELLGVGHNYLAADLEFACKAGSAGIQLISGLVQSTHVKYGLAIGADSAQAKPQDQLEYTSAAAGVAMLIGQKNLVASLLFQSSYSSDTPDFWRRDGMVYPSHSGRFTGEPAYFHHIINAANQLLKQSGLTPEVIDYCVFHMPNSKFPRDVAQRLGFNSTQLSPSLIVDKIGNPYSASSLLGLTAVMDIAKPGDKIFMVSYGSGAGSDAFLWHVETPIISLQKIHRESKIQVNQQLQNFSKLSYLQYLQQTHKI